MFLISSSSSSSYSLFSPLHILQPLCFLPSSTTVSVLLFNLRVSTFLYRSFSVLYPSLPYTYLSIPYPRPLFLFPFPRLFLFFLFNYLFPLFLSRPFSSSTSLPVSNLPLSLTHLILLPLNPLHTIQEVQNGRCTSLLKAYPRQER